MNAEVKIEIPAEVIEHGQHIEQELTRVAHFAIATSEAYADAGEELKRVKGDAKKLEDMKREMLDPLAKAEKAIREHFRKPEAWLKDREDTLKRAMLAYQEEQRREQQRREREAAEAQRKERERLALEAARKREEAAKKRAAEEERARKLEAQGKAEQAEARRLAAIEAEEQRLAEADALQEAAVTMPTAPVVARAVPKVAGISTREVWKANCTNLKALCRAIADGEAPLDLVQFDQSAGDRYARAMKAQLNYPGVRAARSENLASKSA